MTFIIHTFKRPEQLARLLKSIKRYYPEVETIVYDDSDHDRGLSYGRNWLVSNVKTDYYVLLDDDFVFTEKTKIDLLKKKLDEGYDIVAGALEQDGKIRHFEGQYDLKDGHLKYLKKEPYDFVFNFFMAKKSVSGWDERLKLAEHTAFFLSNKGKWKIGYEPNCVITHIPYEYGEYVAFRNRAGKYFDDYMVWNGLKTVTNLDNGVYKLGDYKKLQKDYEDSIS